MFRNRSFAFISFRVNTISLSSVPVPVRLKVPGVKEAVGSKSVVTFTTLPEPFTNSPDREPTLKEYGVSPASEVTVALVAAEPVLLFEIVDGLLDQGVV